MWKKLCILCLGGLGLAACEPLEGDAWVNNEVYTLNWTLANQETGRRPATVEACDLIYYPQAYASYTQLPFEEIEDKGSVSVPTGRYDVLAVSASQFVQQREYYRTARVVYPTRYNDNGDCVLDSIPDQMIYAACVENLNADSEVQSNRIFFLKRLLKKMTFVVNIFDYQELTQDIQFEISGLATEMRISTGELTGDKEAVMSYPLKKSGREGLSDLGCHTKYKGTTYILGTMSNNIVYIYYTDYRGLDRKVALDITSYLKEWNTEEVVVYINVDSPHDEGAIEKWDTESGDIVLEE